MATAAQLTALRRKYKLGEFRPKKRKLTGLKAPSAVGPSSIRTDPKLRGATEAEYRELEALPYTSDSQAARWVKRYDQIARNAALRRAGSKKKSKAKRSTGSSPSKGKLGFFF